MKNFFVIFHYLVKQLIQSSTEQTSLWHRILLNGDDSQTNLCPFQQAMCAT